MAVGSTMESYAARLASFNVTHPPTKKRASNTSSGKTLKWPHKNPSPPKMARAGFFYQPTSSCPDNTRCYLCKSNLDGWEENDNAVEEHLKHSPDCGWAITIATELEIEYGSQSQEDPMSEKMLDARRMTFGSQWPHENKRGWICKTQKMIEAGWYYCPTLENEDLVKCSYCNLCLDGWEPKDNPWDEHQRRSPNCVVFALSTIAKPKAGRSKKGRASKASRISTQSNFTTVSDGVSVADTDAHGDDSIMSVVEPPHAAKSGKGPRKGAKAKKPVKAKSKRQASKAVEENTQVASSFLEPEDDDFEVKVETASTQSERNKKRKSDRMSTTNDVSNHAEAHNQEEEYQDQPRKRRATRIRGSMAQTRNAASSPQQQELDHDAQMTDAEAIPLPVAPQGQMKGKGGKKSGSSKMRKASAASTASKAFLRATMPPDEDEDIDAALEAELDRPLTDEEGENEALVMTEPKGRRLTRTKPGSRKATASVAPTRRTTRASTVTVDNSTMPDIYSSLPDPADEAHVPIPEKNEHVASMHDSPEQLSPPTHQKKAKTRKISEQQNECNKEPEDSEKTNAVADDKMDDEMPIVAPQQAKSPQASRQLLARNIRVSDIPSSFEATDLASDINSSILGMQTVRDDSGHETDASVVKQARTKRGSRKAPAKKVKGGKKAAPISRDIENIVQPTVDDTLPAEQGTHIGPVDGRTGSAVFVSVEVVELKKQRKPSRAIAKSGKTRKTPPGPEASVQEGSAAPLMDQPLKIAEVETARTSPQQLSAHSTPKPAPSPQSSDAENRPPSSRPSKVRPPPSLQSPSNPQVTRVPLAVTTPISSPSRNNISKLQTNFPWTAIDIEHILEGTPTADKENSPFASGGAGKRVKSLLASPEEKLTVEQWIQSNAQRGEEKLRNECERLVGKFENQGVRALRVLEGIVCAERP